MKIYSVVGGSSLLLIPLAQAPIAVIARATGRAATLAPVPRADVLNHA